jgi:hypothetical protein
MEVLQEGDTRQVVHKECEARLTLAQRVLHVLSSLKPGSAALWQGLLRHVSLQG